MDAITARQLIDLNSQFYQTFALQFSQTRQRIQPGVRKIIETIPNEASILDLGCGNGELWQFLQKGGYSGEYTGLDASQGLLAIAQQSIISSRSISPSFIYADLTDPTWELTLVPNELNQSDEINRQQFDYILAFAVLHHIPGEDLRLDVLKKIRRLISPPGHFIHSEWQFLSSDRLRQRIQPWSAIGLDDIDVDAGDYLLDWRHGGQGLRYVHQFNETELSRLALDASFEITNTYYSDGLGGKLSYTRPGLR